MLSTIIPFTLIVFFIAIGVVLLNQQFRNNLYKKSLEKESLKMKHQENLLQNMVTVQEDERKRIAKDLHDELGAALSISRMMLVQLQQSTPDKSDKINKIQEIIETTLSSTRRISHELMPLTLENLGLEKTLKSVGNQVEETGKIRAKISISELKEPKSWLLELALYRIYSELINNTIKYAEASVLEIEITQNGSELVGVYKDNGNGLKPDVDSNGLGFKSIESRVKMLKGSWEFGNQESGGFYAKFIFPIALINEREG